MLNALTNRFFNTKEKIVKKQNQYNIFRLPKICKCVDSDSCHFRMPYSCNYRSKIHTNKLKQSVKVNREKLNSNIKLNGIIS